MPPTDPPATDPPVANPQGRTDDGRFTGNAPAPTAGTPDDPNSPASIDDGAGSFDINIKTIADEETQKQVKKLVEERKSSNIQIASMKATLDKQEQREQQKIYKKARDTKMDRLRELNSKLADKHKNTSDLDKIDLLIDTAESYKSDFTEYNKGKGKDDDKKKGPVFKIDLKTGLPTN